MHAWCMHDACIHMYVHTLFKYQRNFRPKESGWWGRTKTQSALKGAHRRIALPIPVLWGIECVLLPGATWSPWVSKWYDFPPSRNPAQKRGIYTIKIYDYILGFVVDKLFVKNKSSSNLVWGFFGLSTWRLINCSVQEPGLRVQALNHNCGLTKRPMTKGPLSTHAALRQPEQWSLILICKTLLRTNAHNSVQLALQRWSPCFDEIFLFREFKWLTYKNQPTHILSTRSDVKS